MATDDIFLHPATDIRIAAHPSGLQVTQHKRSYLARKWRLTPEVRGVIETAIDFGLTHLWQQKHPLSDESNHISFSFSHEPDTWVFVIGKEALPPNLRCVTFHKRLKGYLKLIGIGEWESSGGKNILVKPQHLRVALSELPLAKIREGQLPQHNHNLVLSEDRTFVRSEGDLEEALYSAFRRHPQVIAVHRQQSFPRNASWEVAARTDLILEFADKVVIAELKVGNSSEADVAQVCRYLANAELRAKYSHMRVAGH